MSIELIVGLAGQVATWVTVLLIFLTLREMEKQRKISQKPELIIPKISIYGYAQKSEYTQILQVPSIWHSKVLQEPGNYFSDLAKVILYNIGFGAAKNIRLKWTFDLQIILDLIRDYCYQNSLPIVAHIQNNGLTISYPGSGYYSPKDDIFLNIEHEYLMPVEVSPQGLESKLPSSFMSLLSVLAYLIAHQLRDKAVPSLEEISFKIPDMSLELRYDDVGGEEHKKEFRVKALIRELDIPFRGDNHNRPLASGLIEFIDKNSKTTIHTGDGAMFQEGKVLI